MFKSLLEAEGPRETWELSLFKTTRGGLGRVDYKASYEASLFNLGWSSFSLDLFFGFSS